MKTATYFLTLCLLFDCISALIVHEIDPISYDYTIISNYNSPLEIEFPAFKKNFLKRCSWLPITGIIFPGLFIAYSARFDKSEVRLRNSSVYSILSYIGFTCGSIIWLIITTFNEHAWPISPFTYLPMLFLTLAFAYKRAEVDMIWQGRRSSQIYYVQHVGLFFLLLPKNKFQISNIKIFKN